MFLLNSIGNKFRREEKEIAKFRPEFDVASETKSRGLKGISSQIHAFTYETN
jgi:hypothetical protein